MQINSERMTRINSRKQQVIAVELIKLCVIALSVGLIIKLVNNF